MSNEDQTRDREVYEFLLTRLTNVEILEDTGKPNENSIAKQWKQNRIIIRRVLRHALPKFYTDKERKKDSMPALTLGRLVEILAGLQEYWKEKRGETPDIQVPRILTRDEKLTVLRKFSHLSLEEQEKLNLPLRSEELLLQQLVEETITDPIKGLKSQDIISFYQNVLNIYNHLKRSETNFSQGSSDDENETWIRRNIQTILEENYPSSKEHIKLKKVEEFIHKVKREIYKIEYQSGTRQANYVLKEIKDIKKKKEILTLSFIKRLTFAIVENEILNDEFPIHLKDFEIEKLPTLPLYVNDKDRKENRETGLLNPNLLDKDTKNISEEENIKGLEKLTAYKVKVYFSIKLPKNTEGKYKYRFREELSRKISSFNDNYLEFSEEVTGVGSPITHIIAAINKVLLWNIPSLQDTSEFGGRDYLPAARVIYIRDEVLGESSNSPVLSYAVVTLCKKADVEKAIGNNKDYDEVATNQDLVHGEYYGFDLVDVSVQAALYARLRAIKKTGINPQEYLTQLCHSIEEKNALKKAESYLEFYPFSLKAMEGYIEQTIFQDEAGKSKYRSCDEVYNFAEIEPNQPWSLVAYDAHLKITQAYLREGLYKIAKEYLDVFKPHVEKKYVVDDLLLAKYYFGLFRYHYLADLDDSIYDEHRAPKDAVEEAGRNLDNAKECLKGYLQKYDKIGQPSQTNFHPFFYLVSRLFCHRTKLYIFTPLLIERDDIKHTSLREAIYLLEKARIYAARDGSTAHYSYWSSYQAWCYLMTAYLEPDQKEFSKEECIKWAEKLINHAEICYSYTGKVCYQQIKDNTGKTTKIYEQEKYYEKYGKIKIQVVPLIQEIKLSEDKYKNNPELTQDKYNYKKHVLEIDLSILKKINTDENKFIYLFGTHSTMILFSRGMLELCDQETDQFKLKERITEALRIFIYCSAIAEEGGLYNKDGFFINRTPPDKTEDDKTEDDKTEDDKTEDDKTQVDPDAFDSWIKILYPHRLTQFVDLGKLFAVTCKAILLLADSKYEYSKIKKSLEELLTNSTNKDPKQILGQTRFNGQLASQVQVAKRYFQDLSKSKLRTNHSVFEIRDRVVTDIFKIVRRGEIIAR